LDKRASLSEKEIPRLPPYHCSLSSMEILWSQVKSHEDKKMGAEFSVKYRI
jgi:hypothetical protein